MDRKSISKKLRFEVFERNKFTCQYCGRSPQAHDCTLEADHIISVKNGGTNDINNLITSCWDCNRGKGAKTTHLPVIPDKEIELELAKERLEQVIAINEYQRKINEIVEKTKETKYEPIIPYLENLNQVLIEKIKKTFDKNVPMVSVNVFIELIELAREKTKTVDDFMKFLNGCLKQRVLEVKNPELAEYRKEVNYFIYEMSERYNYTDKKKVRGYIEKYGLEAVKECYEASTTWSRFNGAIYQYSIKNV
jgi:hypothetical protein